MHRLLISVLLLTFAPRADLQISASASQDGACSAALADGRSFITGGISSTGPLSSAAYFEPDGRLTAAAPMLMPRTKHICIGLEDGTVLVAGGAAADGVTSSAEIFHPETNTWTPTGPMLTLRQKAAALRLKNGMAVVVGGQISGQAANTLEIYNPVDRRFEQAAGILSPARTGHALALLDDGRVVIAGGLEGKRVLDSIEIFDPSQGVVGGGRMLSPRANFTATALADGRILFAGGTDGATELASAEVYDPATGNAALTAPLSAPRQNHIAVRPSRSENVLISSGTAKGQTVNSAEFFIVSRDQFEPVGESEDTKGASIRIGVLGPDGTIRSTKTYRIR
jgi:large repetitive protein